MVRTNEGGSVLSFAVVGVILAILLVGGVAAVRQHSINSQQAAPAAQKVTKSDKKDTTPAPAASGSQAAVNEGQASSGGSTSAPAPATTQPAPATTNTTQPAAGGQLPHTGPAETLATMTAIGLLTASSIAYVRSRRSLGLSSTSI